MPVSSLSSLDRRKFLRGSAGFALALPAFESFAAETAPALGKPAAGKTPDAPIRRFASFYLPDGVPMPRSDDPAFADWSWFPKGPGKEFRFTKCLDVLEPLREDLTVFSGLSHPAVRRVHGHSNADQFLTGANTGADGDYQNSISLDQVYAAHVGQYTRTDSLVLSTDGGTGSPRGAQTMSFNRMGRPIPAEHRPKRIFDMLFVKDNAAAARRLAMSQSALDDLLADARSLKKSLSAHDQQSLEEYMASVREAERKVEKAKHWLNLPMPTVKVDHLNLDLKPDDPRNYLQTMFELIYLAFKTDSTRVVTYQIGRENGAGASDYLSRAVGFNLTHQLSHNTKHPDGWKNFGTYVRFIAEEYGRFASRLKATPEPAGEGNMLDNSLLYFGSASSAFHLSRNYPLILTGGKNMGFRHGQFLKFGEDPDKPLPGGDAGFRSAMDYQEGKLSNLYLTMLHKLGVQADQFADSDGLIEEV